MMRLWYAKWIISILHMMNLSPILEEISMEEVLYHATYGEYINSIKEKGLGAVQHKNWEFSEDGVVLLTPDPAPPLSFSGSAEEV